MKKFIVLVGKGGRVEIAKRCDSEYCEQYHFYTTVEDEFIADYIVRVLDTMFWRMDTLCLSWHLNLKFHFSRSISVNLLEFA